ncbi:MAG TPA: Fic family protein [Candidatus Pacearchaeota archaeon]|nr:Fic family protein [Candidatus Pacearchaeota archaeon]
MYVEKRKEGNRIKYYLAHSFREGGKVHKIRKFLGKNINEEQLKERLDKAEKIILEEIGLYRIIKDPLKTPLSEKEIESIKNLEKNQKLKIRHLSEKQWVTFSELFSYNTNAIEGSEITKKEVKDILEKGKWPKKSKQDIAEIYGVNEAVKFIRKTKEHMSIKFILDLHKIVFKNSKDFAGKFRIKGQEVVVREGHGNIIHFGAPQSRINSLLNELIKWYNKNKSKYPALVLASVVHNQFENIHPFSDGNGRVGRLLLNNILLKNGLPPVNIDLKNQRRYYKSLQEYQKKGNLRPTIDLLIKEYASLKKLTG